MVFKGRSFIKEFESDSKGSSLFLFFSCLCLPWNQFDPETESFQSQDGSERDGGRERRRETEPCNEIIISGRLMDLI